ncbi:ferritin-like domain-containing protein [Blastomonas sp.]|uniref:YciE/YciF ferroxidase family protein n=1 Tax=Blastomonas sp. TaxID=1909299 RepID=UPI00391B15FE
MSAPENLTDLYTGELQDLWSANDQMAKAVKKMTPKVSDSKLKDMLAKSQEGIAAHTQILKDLLEASGEKVKKEHCKGMEGLVAEAIKHTTEEAPEKGPVLDAVVIAQFQRMSHYGIAGFGTAAAFAEALGEKKAVTALNKATKEIYGSDEYMTKLAETSINVDAKEE